MINRGKIFIYLLLIFVPIFSFPLPHFIFDGVESSRECFEEKDLISFTIYGTLTLPTDLSETKIEDYSLKYMGAFKCILSENENKNNKNRKHKITCSITGSFERRGFILEEPKVYGFDFNNEKGESTWPKIEERKTILIGECGSKIELENEPLLLSSKITNYTNPLNKVRKAIINTALAALPKREAIDELKMNLEMKSIKNKYSLNEAECAYFIYKWIADNIVYDCYGTHHNEESYGENATYKNGKGVCTGFSYLFRTMTRFLDL